jgi:transposase-like protein
MKKHTTEATDVSIIVFDNLEKMVRGHVQKFVQEILEEEVTVLLGRGRHERRAPLDAEGSRNGFGKPRKLTMSSGTIDLRRPRVRGLNERFESKVLPLFEKRTKEVGELLPDLYLHGLSLGDFDLALRGLLGEDAPLSASTIARLKVGWQSEYEMWRRRRLDDEVVYLWCDGVYVKAGLEKEKAALLTIIAGLRDGRKTVLCVEAGHRESTEAWSAILRDLKRRGMNCPRLVLGDGHLGLWGALANVFPEAQEQRCWNHRVMNILDRINQKDQPTARQLVTAIPQAETREEAVLRKKEFQAWCGEKYGDAAKLIDRDWERMVTFYAFPKEHWRHLRTTNPVESPFATVRLRTTASKRFKKVENATAVIWKMLLVAEKSFRRLNAPELLGEVAEGVTYVNGERVKKTQERAAA